MATRGIGLPPDNPLWPCFPNTGGKEDSPWSSLAFRTASFILCVTIIPFEGMSATRKVSLGPYETKLLFTLESRETDLFDLLTVERILGVEENAAAKVVHRLRRKGRAIRVHPGEYLLVPARAGEAGSWSENVFRVLGVLLRKDYYVGFWAALNYWGMTEQIPRTIHVVIPGRRRSFEFQGQPIRFVTLKRDYFFGLEAQSLERGSFYISDREKTILDGLLLPEYCGGLTEVAKGLAAARREIRWRPLMAYERRLGLEAVRRRLGYLLEVLRIEPSFRRRLERDVSGFRWLDPSAPKRRLGYSKRWGLILNVEASELREEGGV